MKNSARLLLTLSLFAGPAGPAAAQAEGVRQRGDTVFLNFTSMDLGAAFESLSAVMGLSYLAIGDLPGKITIRTRRGIPVEQAARLLEAIAQSSNVRLERVGDMYVASAAPGGERPSAAALEREIFVFFLKNADAVETANLLTALFGGETERFERRRLLEGRGLSEQLDRYRLTPEGARVPATAPPEGRAREGVVPGELVGELTIVPDERTNSLVIRTAPANLPSLQRTIERLDVRPLQVLIEVVIAEISLDEQTQFGIDFAAFIGRDAEGKIQNFNPDNLPPDSIGFTASVFDPGRVRAALRALAVDDRLNVLATPRVIASNNQEARILVGSEVPFVQVSSFGGVGNNVIQSVQFTDVGLELNVIPRINQDRQVTLEILQQNSSVTSTSFGNVDAPLITTREAKTRLVVGDRRTVVLGGLIQSQQQRRESGIPLLKDIPLLGNLFKSVQTVALKSELVITLTPYIVASDEELEELRQELERRPDRIRGPADDGASDS